MILDANGNHIELDGPKKPHRFGEFNVPPDAYLAVKTINCANSQIKNRCAIIHCLGCANSPVI